MDITIILIEKFFWSGVAAIGFGILFNIPPRTIFTVGILGAFAGLIKFSLLASGLNVMLASLAAATFVGLISVPLSHSVHTPPFVFSIPAIIPMIPGYFGYKMMLGLFNLTIADPSAADTAQIASVFNYGLKMIFVLFSLTIGVSMPMLILRKQTVKNIKIKNKKRNGSKDKI